jgi:hypothetical protein
LMLIVFWAHCVADHSSDSQFQAKTKTFPTSGRTATACEVEPHSMGADWAGDVPLATSLYPFREFRAQSLTEVC